MIKGLEDPVIKNALMHMNTGQSQEAVNILEAALKQNMDEEKLFLLALLALQAGNETGLVFLSQAKNVAEYVDRFSILNAHKFLKQQQSINNEWSKVSYIGKRYYDTYKMVLKYKGTDAFVISYPQSGESFLRTVLVQYITKLNPPAVDESQALDEFLSLSYQDAFWPATAFSQDCFPGSLPMQEIKLNAACYEGKKIVFLYADPRTTLVNAFAAKERDNVIDDFVLGDEGGIDGLVTFYNLWAGYVQSHGDAMMLSYEEMQENPKDHIAELITFLVGDVDVDLLAQAIEKASVGQPEMVKYDAVLNPKTVEKIETIMREKLTSAYAKYL